MKKSCLTLLILVIILNVILVPVKAKSKVYPVRRYKGKTNIQIIENFKMPQFNKNRKIWVYLPPDYYATDKQYPVLYMNDGQNLFNKSTSYGGWKVDETLDRLFKQNKTEGIIVVGINNGGEYRADEYEYLIRPLRPSLIDQVQGKRYVNFLINTLKPYIDQHYRTLPDREHTGIAGSATGARNALYAGFDHPEVFSKVAAFSFVQYYIPLVFKEKVCFKKKQEMKIYLDIGAEEKRGKLNIIESAKDFYKLMQEMGFKQKEIKLVIDKGGKETEKAWARRFPPAFLWLFEGKEIPNEV